MPIPLDDAVVCLTSSDQKKVELPVKAAKHSVLISNALALQGDEDEDSSDNDQDLAMELPNVESKSLEKVVEFMNHYEENPFPSIPERFQEKTFEENIKGQWYTQYMQELEGNGADDLDLFYGVKSAANYMDIKPLLEMICLWLTFKIEKMKSHEEIRQLLRLPKMDAADEEQARREHPWMFMYSDNAE